MMSSLSNEFQIMLPSYVNGNLKTNQAYMRRNLQSHWINLTSGIWP